MRNLRNLKVAGNSSIPATIVLEKRNSSSEILRSVRAAKRSFGRGKALCRRADRAGARTAHLATIPRAGLDGKASLKRIG